MTICINELKDLPALSSSARDILKIIHDEDADIGHFSQIIERDPALLSKIIGLANSAFFGTRSVTDARRAIIDVLGFRTAKNIALGVILGGVFNPKQCQSFDLPKYWFVSLVTATLARDIAIGVKKSSLDASEAYLSGMLNEIGLMALAYWYPGEMGQILVDDELSIVDQENNFFGQNHYDISAHFLHEWQIPEIVTNVMLETSENSQRECGQLCHLVFLANTLAKRIYSDETVDIDKVVLPEILSGQSLLIDSIIEKARGQVDTYREMANLLS